MECWVRPRQVAARTVHKDTLGAFVTRLAGMPLNFEPGTAWHYGAAGNGLAVVGRLVEVISGRSLDQFLSERILRPLKMNDTYFYLPESKLPRFAATYRPDANKKIELDEAPTTNSLFFRERTYFSGGGGLVSTASDYLRFQLMLLSGGELDGVRILGRKTVELMSSNHTGNLLVVNRGPGSGFGLGVSVLVDLGASGQLGSEGMFGWGGAFNTITFVDPKEDMIGIMMSQVRPNDTSTFAATSRRSCIRRWSASGQMAGRRSRWAYDNRLTTKWSRRARCPVRSCHCGARLDLARWPDGAEIANAVPIGILQSRWLIWVW